MRSSGRWRLFFALLALACQNAPTTETLPLIPGTLHSRTLTRAAPHRFRFTAKANLFLHLTINQRGVDVVVFLRDPTGRLLFEVDSPTGKTGPETVLAVTPVVGEYEMAVEPLSPEATGAFTLEVREVRPATARDRRRASAASAFARGERRRRSRDFEEAAAAYRASLPGFQAEGAWKELAQTESGLGETLLATGDLHQSAMLLERSAVRFRNLGDRAGEARALSLLGAASRRLGEIERSLSAHRRALQLYRETGNEKGEATALNDIGLVLDIKGDLQGAIGHAEAALVLWRRLGPKSSEATTLQNLGRLYALIGHDAEALDLLQKALKLLGSTANDTANDRQRTSALIDLGWAHALAGRPEVALDCYQEALSLAQRSDNRSVEMGAWDRRGSALRSLRRFREAGESYGRALAMSRAAGRRLDEGHTLANLGWLALETGDASSARERLRQAVELLAAAGDPNGEVYARVGLSRAERSLSDFAAARIHAETAIRLVEELRTGLRGPVSRSHFLATRYDAYEELVALLLELDRREPNAGHAREALEVTERSRARRLLDEMTLAERTAGRDAQTASQEANRRRSLEAEIRTLDERRQALVAQNPRDPILPDLDADLRQRWLELDQLAAPPRPQPGLTPATAADIQTLADGLPLGSTLFIVYLLAEPESFAWTVDRQSVVLHRLPGRERIEKLTRRLVLALPRSHEIAVQGTADKAARDLSDAILAPLANRLAGRHRLAILADAALHLVPFSVLPEP
ncbi:MAG TPA: tetratricopeptide repeat protein, partial [Thermoanaerobaculia bacterium]